MPAYQLQQVALPDERRQEQTPTDNEQKQTASISKIEEELAACEEVTGVRTNNLRYFLLQEGIQSISEMDYSLRLKYEDYLRKRKKAQRVKKYILIYDRVKQYSIREQMKTLPGRQRCQWKLRNDILYIPYHSDQELAMAFDTVRHHSNMVWDFTRDCSLSLKQQIFTVLNAVIDRFHEKRRREHRLSGLQCLYDFCVEQQIEDITQMELWQEKAFESYLAENTSSLSRQMQLLPILNFSRKTLFLQNQEILWDAHIWYLERLKLPDYRSNPSTPIESLSFIEITHLENRYYAKEYAKYQLAITRQAVSTIWHKIVATRDLLIYLSENEQDVRWVSPKQIDNYFKEWQEKNITAKTFNGHLIFIHQFFQFLVARNYMSEIPFYVEYYQKKIVPKHHNRSVAIEASQEILAKLHNLPEDMRCIYLHFWCLGLRISEVCTLKGNAYYKNNEDAWLQIYQIKMKTYKRIPIPEGLYQIMQVYIKRHNIAPDEYLFTNAKGGAYNSLNFQEQMKKFCQKQGIQDGEYSFRSHDYRHTVATIFYDNGVSLQSIRDYLGHDQEEMTQQYLDYMPQKIAKASEVFFEQQNDNSLAASIIKK